METITLDNQKLLNSIRRVLQDPGRFYPLHEPEFDADVVKEVENCIQSGWVSSSGKNIVDLETQCAEILNIKNCIAVSSGTAALHLALIVAGVESDNEVFCPGISFAATAAAIRYTNAHPYFIDIDRNTLCLSADALMAEIKNSCDFSNGRLKNRKNGKTISAIVVVNAFGNSPILQEISKIAKNYNLKLIEDAAGAFGSRYLDQTPGFFSDVATYSFNGNKILTSGAGGMVVTRNSELAKKVRHISTTAKLAHPWEYNHDLVGYNYRMPNLNATLLLAQLGNFENILSKKRKLYSEYTQAFSGLNIKVLSEGANCFSNYWLICADLQMNDVKIRDAILKYLNENNIMARPLWTPLFTLTPYKDNSRGLMKNCDNAFINIINIPSSPNLMS